MIKNLFKKQKKENQNDKYLPIIALLVHAAKIDEKYTETEKTIIKKVIMELNKISLDESKKILEIAEKAEEKSNQIVGFTSEIKKYSMEFRLKIIEIIWKIVYSDGASDNYESNLVRRLCGLLYVSDRDSGMIKSKVQENITKK
tara:strand:- start:270 stop:701 length:432 start_codon:yes stop_codon:yes gene_type:complete